MLSRQLSRGCDSGTTAPPLQPLAFPPHPQLLLTGICPVLQHHLGVPSPPYTPDSLDQTKTLSDYVDPSSQAYFPHQTTKEEGWRMTSSFSSTPPPEPTSKINFTFKSRDPSDAVFSFRISTQPEMALSFPPRPSPARPRKRCRAAADVDGEHSSLHKKKRRLRLFLITSRLSPQFSHPATNIVDRGSSKIAVWAKQKALGRNLLRKAAILNRIRWRTLLAKETEGGLGRVLVEQEREQEQLRLAKLTFVYGSHDSHTRPVISTDDSYPPSRAVRKGDHFELTGTSPSNSPPGSPPLRGRTEDDVEAYRSPNEAYSYSPPRSTSPRRSYLPLCSSPLGLSNYDAFDVEDDIPDPYAHLDDEYDMVEQHDDDEDHAFPPRGTTSNRRPSTPSRRESTDGTGASTQSIYSDFGVLDPDEPVVGDYDQVDDGANAIWPSSFIPDTGGPSVAHPLSSSPDFSALFATSLDESLPLSPVSTSPNFAPFSALAEETNMVKDDSAVEVERQRQRNFMFMRFES